MLPAYNFSEQVYVVTNQLLQESSVTWDLSHSINDNSVISLDKSVYVTQPPLQQLPNVQYQSFFSFQSKSW